MKKALPGCCLFLMVFTSAFGQEIPTSTKGVSTPGASTPGASTLGASTPGHAYAKALYDSATVESQHLYNGQQYFVYDSQAEEHQFFLSRNWITGSVFYDGQQFDSIPLMYDIVKDQVVVQYTQSFGNVSLQSEKVSHFYLSDGELAGHTFIRLEGGQNTVTGIRTGFYDLVYDGTSRVIARRAKTRQQTVSDTRIIVTFPYKETFYLYTGGKYHQVASKKSVLAFMPDQKRVLSKYLKEQKIKFRHNREAAILALASHYDQLSKP